MVKLQLTGQNLGRIFYSRLGRALKYHTFVYITKQPNLKLKTRPKQLLGSFALPEKAAMDKLQLTGRNLGRVFYFTNGCVNAMHFLLLRSKTA
jgi:hypothetical protein